ncbi:MAG: hypothetical protein J6R99_02785 [Alphaproteobacteria bacterium]|nr:hypothetical protein [Alphaproteobacteria bacterium]MBO7066611.1 hypothetical protein [Alphaproteobacteria bacterium]
MNHNIADQFINLLVELYDLDTENATQLRNGADLIEKSLGQYYWEDVRNAVNYYFVRKNDKTRPTLGKILAILETNPDVKKRAEIEDDDTEVKPLYPRPRTNIRIIQDSFNRLIDVLMDCNVIPDKDGHFNGHASLVCDDGFVMLNPVQNLRWQVEDAINAHPNAFAPFPDMTLWEQLALAVQNHFITLHRRTWA